MPPQWRLRPRPTIAKATPRPATMGPITAQVWTPVIGLPLRYPNPWKVHSAPTTSISTPTVTATLVPTRSAQDSAVGRDQVVVPAVGVLGGALLAVVVDMHQPEPLGVALGPLEVVHQRPGVVAADVDLRLDRRRDGPEVGVEVGDALRIVNLAVGVHDVVVRAAVLGDVDGRQRGAVPRVQPDQHVSQPFGHD